MVKQFFKLLLLLLSFMVFTKDAQAQKAKTKKKAVQAAPIPPPAAPVAVVDTVKPAVVIAPPTAPKIDSLPIPKLKKSLRPDNGADTDLGIKERLPLPYEHLRADDAVYRHKIWREIDAREKVNLPFMYSADEDNGNQRFLSILMKAIQDTLVTVFDAIDDRFTTPMTISQVNFKITEISAMPKPIVVYCRSGNRSGMAKTMLNQQGINEVYNGGGVYDMLNMIAN